MKNVVITGSARGLGYEMAKVFRQNNCNVIISDLNEDKLKEARKNLKSIDNGGLIYYYVCDVTKISDISNLINFAKEKFGSIDIWINNAGVNQPPKAIWELSEEEIDLVFDIDLKGAVMSSKLVMEEMANNSGGAIYNVEGYGSNDATMLGLSIYGTSKRAITYFTKALAKESEERKTGVLVGILSPGIMITDFITNALGNKEKIVLSEKTKNIYNILGDYPDVVAKFLVRGILKNRKNNVKIEWLTNVKVVWRFMTARFNKRDFFKEGSSDEVSKKEICSRVIANKDKKRDKLVSMNENKQDIRENDDIFSTKPYQRRIKSNSLIESQGIVCYENLPVTEDSSAVKLKDIDTICKRAIACLISTQLACDLDNDQDYENVKNFALGLLNKYDVENALLDIEKKLFNGSYTKQDIINVTWTYESYWCLVWSLGLIDKLEFPDSLCDVDTAVKLLVKCNNYDEFKKKCKMRDIEEVLDAFDLYYRYHWACVENSINPSACIGKLNSEVVIERRRGLEWLVSEEEDWNNISLDT